MSKKTGIPVGTLNKYVALRSVPSALNALKIAQAVGLSLEELAAGRSPTTNAEADLATPPPFATSLNPKLMRRLADLVEGSFKEEGARIRNADLTMEAAHAYNDLLELVGGELTDAESVEAAMPLVKRRLQKRLSEAASNPGSGKRSA